MSTPPAFRTIVRKLMKSKSTPPIIPIPADQHGNQISFSENKSRRTWSANIRKLNFPVTILGGEGAATAVPMRNMRRLAVRARDVKKIEQRGSIEGVLLSYPFSKLTPFGAKLRHALFHEIHRMKHQSTVDRLNEFNREIVLPPAALRSPDQAGDVPRIGSGTSLVPVSAASTSAGITGTTGGPERSGSSHQRTTTKPGRRPTFPFAATTRLSIEQSTRDFVSNIPYFYSYWGIHKFVNKSVRKAKALHRQQLLTGEVTEAIDWEAYRNTVTAYVMLRWEEQRHDLIEDRLEDLAGASTDGLKIEGLIEGKRI